MSIVSQFVHSPSKEHLEAVFQILRYLKATDADWVGLINDRRSTFGYCTFLWGNLLTYRGNLRMIEQIMRRLIDIL